MHGSIISIRTAGPQDAGLLAKIGAQTFRHSFARDNTPEDMAAYLAGAFGTKVQAAGYARLVRAPAPACIPPGSPIEIRRIYAVPAWLGRGVGAALMRACLAEASRQRCEVIWLDVWERNERAIAFYKRRGFVQVGTQAFVLGSDVQRDLLLARPVMEDARPAG
jgi:ribosomal protein S18 acetylase RimI-like enzyme